MMHKTCRCVKCKTKYNYQVSGCGCNNELNDDRYCPDCMKLINKALKNVKVQYHDEYLPIFDEYPKKISVEEFDQHFEDTKKGQYNLVLYPVLFGFDGNAYDVRIGSTNYRKYVGKDGEVLITVQYEVNNKNEVTGLW